MATAPAQAGPGKVSSRDRGVALLLTCRPAAKRRGLQRLQRSEGEKKGGKACRLAWSHRTGDCGDDRGDSEMGAASSKQRSAPGAYRLPGRRAERGALECCLLRSLLSPFRGRSRAPSQTRRER